MQLFRASDTGAARSSLPHTIDPLRVAFVLKDLQLSGGVGVVVEHASRLRADHGIDAQLVLSDPETHPRWAYPRLGEVPVLTLDDARQQRWDVGVATWWETATVLFHLECERYAFFIQALEDSLARPSEPERVTAPLATALPVRFITEAHWIAEMLASLQPGNPALVVRNGIDKGVFEPVAEPAAPSADEPLRVLVEGSPSTPLKGVAQTFEALALMREDAHVTWVAPHGAAEVPAGVDRVLERQTHSQMAALYAESHVLVKLSRAEGMYGPPLEGFHKGCTVVTTAVTGHEEYVRHMENGLVVGWDDVHGTARALDLLAKDRQLLATLRTGAVETARAWPDWDASTAEFADALRSVAAEPPPPVSASGVRLAAEIATVTAELQRRDRDLESAHKALENFKAERAWVLATKVRGAYHRVRRR